MHSPGQKALPGEGDGKPGEEWRKRERHEMKESRQAKLNVADIFGCKCQPDTVRTPVSRSCTSRAIESFLDVIS